jgi:hypothetical protein
MGKPAQFKGMLVILISSGKILSEAKKGETIIAVSSTKRKQCYFSISGSCKSLND